jgi:Transposase DDE domain
MTSIPQVSAIVQQLVSETANAIAVASGFSKRRAKITGAVFVQTLVFGWLANPEATMSDLSQTSALVGTPVSAAALEQRFSAAGADCLRGVLAAAVRLVVRGAAVALPVLDRFPAVTVQDSTVIALPAALAERWPGCGGSTPEAGAAALKVDVRYGLGDGGLDVLDLQPGRSSDQTARSQTAPLPAGSLKLHDLGYVSLERLAALVADGVHTLCRLKSQTTVVDASGRRWRLAALLEAQPLGDLDLPVGLGEARSVCGRLLARRVPVEVAAERRRKLRAEAQREGRVPSAERLALCAWTVYFTTVTAAQLTLDEALVLARQRWQIELLFKLWKSQGKLDESRGANPLRVLCEVYAKLLALLIQHWLFLTSCWRYPDKRLVKASATVRRFATWLAGSLAEVQRFSAVLVRLASTLAAGCRVGSRGTRRPAYQLLQALADDCDTHEADAA